ncbi:MAG TPA: ATP-binding protein [Atribacteraceae bacterium]|nr:ATP-binding protein [Atribacteraceae bacterium]
MLTDCPFCGLPFVEANLALSSFGLMHLSEKLKWKSQCSCLTEEKEREIWERLEERRRANRQAAVKVRYRESRMPPRFLRRTFESYLPADQRQQEALERCAEYAGNFLRWKNEENHSLLLSGPSDRGKSHLAQAIANTLLAVGCSLIYENWVHLLSRFRRAFRDREGEAEKQPLLDCDCLVLDDLGVGGGETWVVTTLYEIIDHRLEWDRPTVITTNLAVAELGELYGGRVASRLGRGYRVVRV